MEPRRIAFRRLRRERWNRRASWKYVLLLAALLFLLRFLASLSPEMP